MRTLNLFQKVIIAMSFLMSASAFAATYEVPVSNELQRYAQFQIQSPELSHQGGTIFVHYQLPPELVGPHHPGVTMKTDNYGANQFEMSSENGIASCSRTDHIRCNLKLKNLNIQPADVKQYVSNLSKSEAEFQGRMKVAQFFGTDPVGVLNY